MELAKMMITGCAGAVLALGTPAGAQTLHSGDAGFGKQWVRTHPFTLEGDSLYPATWDFAEYFGAGMNTLMKDVGYHHTINPLNRPSQFATAPWQAILPVPTGNPQAGITEYNNLRQTPYNVGWIVGDEPTRVRMDDHAAVMSQIRQDNLNQIAFTTISNNNGPDGIWYGDGAHPNYTYQNYLDDFVSIIRPDVLFYDYYPFRTDGTTDAKYTQNLMMIRNKALAEGIPYWAWVQGFGLGTSRAPSESDNRYNVYTHLTAGFTGLVYWTYDYYAGTGNALIDINGNPTAMYDYAKQTNLEAANLGKSLRFLTSTDVRFVPGRHQSGIFTTPNDAPLGLTSWSAGAGGDPHLTDAKVNWNLAGGIGTEKNGLLGLFTDDSGQDYFMLTNLNHGMDMTAAQTALTFTLTFDSQTNSLLRLDRLTGEQEIVNLVNHQLIWTLPGGTGDLFKYNTGDFVVPEPAGLGLLAAGMMIATARGRRDRR
ncbi:MAG: hypothetical protein IT447_09710 [Phycisphaerales bacterium]|jgi:hypothetical protein|nr:hypothetical protein [Phycisphaerales bacterium]